MMNKTAPKQAVKQAVQDIRKKLGNVGITPTAAKADVAAKMAESRAPQMPSPGMGASAPNAAKADVAAKMAESRAPQMPSPGGAPMTTPKAPSQSMAMRKGGAVRSKPQTKFASGGSVSSASKRGDGIAQRGKTKGRMC